MTIENVIAVLNAVPLTAETDVSKEITGGYVCDLLSLAMGKVQAGDIWITVQTNVNIVAVASLTEAACVLVAENMNVEESVIKKAESEGVVLLRTDKNAYEAAAEVSRLL